VLKDGINALPWKLGEAAGDLFFLALVSSRPARGVPTRPPGEHQGFAVLPQQGATL
jgi:hypothetical protein